jgi:phage N-6-adenine-methyltransferase
MPRAQRQGVAERRERLRSLMDGSYIPRDVCRARISYHKKRPSAPKVVPPEAVPPEAVPEAEPAGEPAGEPAAEAKRKRAVNRKRNRLAPAGPLTLHDWYCTPPEIFASLEAEFGPFTLDAAASRENALAARFFTQQQDGLQQRWCNADKSPATVFVNPPYGLGLACWIEKAIKATGAVRPDAQTVVMLLPLYGDVKWFHEAVLPFASELVYICGRLKFVCPTATGSAACPNASVVAVFRHGRPRLRVASLDRGGGAVMWHRTQ